MTAPAPKRREAQADHVATGPALPDGRAAPWDLLTSTTSSQILGTVVEDGSSSARSEALAKETAPPVTAQPPLYTAGVTARKLAAMGWRQPWCRESAGYGQWRSYAVAMAADYRKGQCLLPPEVATVVERICPPAGSGRPVEPHWQEIVLAAAVRDGRLDLATYASIRWAPVVAWRRDLAYYVQQARRVMAQAAAGESVDGSVPSPSRWRPSRVALWADQRDAAVRSALLAAAAARVIETRPGWINVMSAAAA